MDSMDEPINDVTKNDISDVVIKNGISGYVIECMSAWIECISYSRVSATSGIPLWRDRMVYIHRSWHKTSTCIKKKQYNSDIFGRFPSFYSVELISIEFFRSNSAYRLILKNLNA